MTYHILIAGFGGQGVLFAGKFLTYLGMMAGKEVSWLPSYGPEMRGGTANCSVILSDDPVGSPIVSHPDILIVMNLPSLDKYEGEAVPGAKLFADSTLIARKVARTDVTPYYLPATEMARAAGIPTLANMMLVGKVLREVGIPFDHVEAALKKVVSARHADLYDANLRAVRTGYES